MDKLHGLLYPTCYLRQGTMLRLAQVFSRLILLIPTEDTHILPYRPLDNCPMEIEPIAPVPMGDRLGWFADLISNWKFWAKEMGLGKKISAFTLMSAAADKQEEESVQTILSAIKKDVKATDPLLNAQIFLQLALDLDRREDELHIDLDRLAVQEDRLKLILQGPERPTKSPGSIELDPMIAPLSMARERLKAWTVLWQKFTDKRSWPIGESVASKDLLDTVYGGLQPKVLPIDLLDLALPPDPDIRPGESEEICNMLTAIIDAIPKATIQDINGEGKIQELVREIGQKWEKFTGSQAPGPRLKLTVYPQKTWEEVLLKANNLEPRDNQTGSLITNGWSFFLY
ncbi:MAG: hypothetical protein GWP10_00485 [Nitrospiraceae bacterium]|nr:hypothetical protein [Nitrospiraceae bacterium]